MSDSNDNYINNCWLDIKSRIHIWELIYEKEKLSNSEISAKNKIKLSILKVYELVVIFSSLSCAALVGISSSDNDNATIIIIYDCLRGYGIISSCSGAIISLAACMILSALPEQYIMDYLETFMKYSNIPVFTSVFSIFSMMICASLQFNTTIMLLVLPYSIICFFYSLYIYNNLRKKLVTLIDKTE
tara:strand:- start:286 stop:846 length:561 start_codon:yes stop_codon:yes gene_type:complete